MQVTLQKATRIGVELVWFTYTQLHVCQPVSPIPAEKIILSASCDSGG